MTANQANLIFWLALGAVCLCYPPIVGFLFGVAVISGLTAIVFRLLRVF